MKMCIKRLPDISFSGTISVFCVAIAFILSGVAVQAADSGSGEGAQSPICIEIKVDCLDASGIDPDRVRNIMRELHDLSGIRIVSMESVPESVIKVDVDTTRAEKCGINTDDVIRTVVAKIQLPVISRDDSSVTFEYIRSMISVQELGRVVIVTVKGEPFFLSDIAVMSLGAYSLRRKYISGDRFVIIRVAGDSDSVLHAENTLRRRFGGMAWIKIDKE